MKNINKVSAAIEKHYTLHGKNPDAIIMSKDFHNKFFKEAKEVYGFNYSCVIDIPEFKGIPIITLDSAKDFMLAYGE